MLKINLVYHGKCFNENNRHDYIGGTDNRIEQQIIDHNKLDKISHFLRIARKIEHHHIWHNDFKIIGSNYCSSFKMRISDALFIKQLKPTLNK